MQPSQQVADPGPHNDNEAYYQQLNQQPHFLLILILNKEDLKSEAKFLKLFISFIILMRRANLSVKNKHNYIIQQ